MIESQRQDHGSAPEAERLTRAQKLGTLLIFLAIFSIAMILICLYRSVIRENPWLGVSFILSASMVIWFSPYVAARWSPRLAGFDRTWRFHIGGIFLLLVGVFIWNAAWGALGKAFGLETRIRDVNISWVQTPEFLIVMALIMVVIGPIAEEIFWRGYALDQFEKVAPRKAALFIQAALFALSHLRPFWLTVQLLGFGVIQGMWRQRKRSMIPLIVAHILINSGSVLPHVPQQYRDAQFMRVLERNKALGPGWLSAMVGQVRSNPACHELNDILEQPAQIAIPESMRFLVHNEDIVQKYAATMIAKKWEYMEKPQQEDELFLRALHSGEPLMVVGVMETISNAHMSKFIPNMREKVMNSKDFSVQFTGVWTLGDMGDLEGLRMIATQHSSRKIREAAEARMEIITGIKEDAHPGISLPTDVKPNQQTRNP